MSGATWKVYFFGGTKQFEEKGTLMMAETFSKEYAICNKLLFKLYDFIKIPSFQNYLLTFYY
jgi:hypothetical protein